VMSSAHLAGSYDKKSYRANKEKSRFETRFGGGGELYHQRFAVSGVSFPQPKLSRVHQLQPRSMLLLRFMSKLWEHGAVNRLEWLCIFPVAISFVLGMVTYLVSEDVY